jgi:flagellar basal body rod protein FlgG
MLRSLYNASSALHVLERQHEQTANNLANINTSGYRRIQSGVAERGGRPPTRGHFGFGPEIDSTKVDFSQGRLVETRRPLDLAISGDAFFVLQAPSGEQLYTRNGRFYRDVTTGELRSDNNLPVVGKNGTLTIQPGLSLSEVSIGTDGYIVAAGQQIGQLEIVAFENNNTLRPITQTVFRRSTASTNKESTAEIQQYYQEVSNVNPTSELIALIVGGRHYDALQKASRTIAETMQQSIRA